MGWNRCQLLISHNFQGFIHLFTSTSCFVAPSFSFFSPHFLLLVLFAYIKTFFSFAPRSNTFASERHMNRQEMKGEGGKDRVRAIRAQMEWMKKNQQSHVRLVKINSFSLHSLFVFLFWRAQGAFSKCLLRDA